MRRGGLTEAQREVLSYLAACEHSTSNIMRSNYRSRGKRFPGATLAALERAGYVTSEYSRTPMSRNQRWTITDAGREALS